VTRFAWLKSGLFWRTFVLLAFLIALSMAAWVASFQFVERGPRARQIAAQMISIVTVTRAALTHSAPDLRRELLFELASNEGIRIYPLEKTDLVEPTSDSSWMQMIQASVKEQLGDKTRFASRVNNVGGFWISFDIENDEYWLMLDRERIGRTSGAQWIGWATLVLVLSLIGAVFISRLINQPLAQLSAAARTIAVGRSPEPLPEEGPAEIRETNSSFNHMAADLHRIETDRAVILAGISHDLRTPITRMHLELEMADLPPDAKKGMLSDLAQMDAIIGQFLDYARPAVENDCRNINLSTLVAACAQDAGRQRDVRIVTVLAPNVTIQGNETDLKRVVNNLIENARRYGKKANTDVANVDIYSRIENGMALLTILDRGPGVPDAELERLLKPFVRMDAARGQANGAGLGLAIVDRIVRRHNGRLRLSRGEHGGLVVSMSFPLAG
jgi:two-component system osmolarity sensor histidine kinase EnvZ